MSPIVAKKMLSFFTNKNVLLVAPSNSEHQLTEREKNILQLMVQGHNYKRLLKSRLSAMKPFARTSSISTKSFM
jgi:hypothetical protein